MSKFKSFYKSLSAADRSRFAEKIGTSQRYIEGHLLDVRKVPRRELMAALIAETWALSDGRVGKHDVLDHFFS